MRSMSILHRFATIAWRGALYAFLVLLLDAVALGLDSLILGRNAFHFFTLITLGESALFFLIGGAVDVGGSISFHKVMNHVSKRETYWSTENHRNAQSRAGTVIFAGVILFALSFALAYPLN